MDDKKLDIIFNGLGTFGGLIALIKGLIINASTLGGTESPLMYGGDAYTGIQNASAQAATNVYYSNEILVSLASGILLALGLGLIAFFGKKLLVQVMDLKANNGAKAIITTEETTTTEE